MKQLFLILTMALSICTINAQTTSPELLSSAGDSFKNTSYQLNWSIGELQTETYTAGGQKLTQGFHQTTYTVSTVVKQVNGLQFEMKAYPNPTSDLITIEWKNASVFEKAECVYNVTNVSGNVLQTGNLKETYQQIDFSNYVVGTYFITVMQNNLLVKSFKIIKK